MTIFDLLFIAVVFASLATFVTAAIAAIRGRCIHALGILRKFGVCALAYLTIVVVVALLSPQRVLSVGDPWCFDDWCLSVEKVSLKPEPPQVACHVSLRIFSQARRVSQRAKGAWIFAIDRHGNRYPPEPDPSAVPLDVLLQPGESVVTSRVFKVPADSVAGIGLITGHGGPGCFPGCFIIGSDASLFHKRTFVLLQP
jgi:hypothetical protein